MLDLREPFRGDGTFPQRTGHGSGRSSFLLTTSTTPSASHYRALCEVSRTPRASPAVSLLRRLFYVKAPHRRITPEIQERCAHPPPAPNPQGGHGSGPPRSAPRFRRSVPPSSRASFQVPHIASAPPPPKPHHKKAHRQPTREKTALPLALPPSFARVKCCPRPSLRFRTPFLLASVTTFVQLGHSCGNT